MRGLSDPEQLARHLAENAAAWKTIRDGVDARALGIFGRLEALARFQASLQQRALAPYRLNYAEFTTIGMLRTSPPAFRRSPTELRRLVGQSSAGMTRILAKLEGEGLVRRAAGRGDGRRRDVILSARGRAVAERSFAALLAAQGHVLASTGKRRRDDLLLALDALLAAFARRA
ncbi:MAG TPA: MarR family transcriptional regulator [Myxococcota bacterium]|nr:MarR family transcriptional regulator [Myxococcota bacterium]